MQNNGKQHELGLLNDSKDINENHHEHHHDSNEKLIHHHGKKTEEYKSSFTVHGLSKICLGSRAESIFWLIVLLIGLAYAIYVVHRLVTTYLLYEIYTEVYQKVATKNYFPSVTFCDETLMTNNYFKYCGARGENLKHDDSCESLLKPLTTIKNDKSDGSWSNGFFHVTTCLSWDSKYCSNDKYLKSLNKHDHACFTWNPDGTFHDALYGHATIHFQMNKTSGRNHSKIIALVHDAKIQELDVTNRFFMEPSKSYELRIGKTYIKRLPSPFPSDCAAKNKNQFYPGKYSRRLCVDSISYINMYKKCGDIMDYHKRLIPKDIIRKYRQNRTRADTWKCLLKFSLTKVEVTDECPFPCEELEYQTMTTFHGLEGKDDSPNDSKYRVDVQLQNVDSYRVLEEKQLFTWDQVLGEVGGLLGLFIGASVISLIEILAYFYLLAVQRCVRNDEQ